MQAAIGWGPRRCSFMVEGGETGRGGMRWNEKRAAHHVFPSVLLPFVSASR
jgi:hypothetical protein